MALQVSDFYTWHGTVDRKAYFALGVILFAFKHLLDRFVASFVFEIPWGIFNYWVAGDAVAGIHNTPVDLLKFYATMVAISLPFIWVGVVLTIRRLRDIGWPMSLVGLFFVPFLNLLFFLLLCVVPSQEEDLNLASDRRLMSAFDRVIPKSGFGSAVAGVAATTALTVVVTLLAVQGLGNYGWGLFVGLPFLLGFSSVLIYSYHQPRTIWQCLGISFLSVVLASAALMAVAIEGVVCIIMAAPLGLAISLIGGITGFYIQYAVHETMSGIKLRVVAIVALALPILMVAESAEHREPALREVRTSVRISASREKVWDELVAFSELDPPTELMFKTGIAYPIHAEIDGQGVGAVRRCVFSTGPFVEPIEVWDQPHLLKFGVIEQPPIMDEMSPYELRPPHLNNYLHSRRGQFLLTSLPNGDTVLEGTTWYQNSFWPAAYWGVWSDEIIHRIHLRVLEHIKRQAEQ